MRYPSRSFAALAALTAVLTVGATGARADVAPPDSCTAPGQPCMNAGPQYDRAGTCVAATCTRTVPAPDGGSMSMSYACNRCQAADGGTGGGAGGAGGGGAGGNGTGAGGSSSPTPSESSGWCAVAAHDDGQAVTPALLLAAGLVLGATRRRRRAG
jgi:MYXO-CTERM domain-containing protein